jgi:hypothetical protein
MLIAPSNADSVLALSAKVNDMREGSSAAHMARVVCLAAAAIKAGIKVSDEMIDAVATKSISPITQVELRELEAQEAQIEAAMDQAEIDAAMLLPEDDPAMDAVLERLRVSGSLRRPGALE